MNFHATIRPERQPNDFAFRGVPPAAYWHSNIGHLHAGDCLDLLGSIADGVVDTFFADPPFAIGKIYGAGYDDNMPDRSYIEWCRTWLGEAIRILKPGGSLFLYNLPKHNIRLGAWLMDQPGMEFRHDITVSMKASFPIRGRLYPAHYSCLYFTKGKPATYRNIRTPIETCRHCAGELRDYGGHRHKMNPKGVNLTDIWADIPTVRHAKYQSGMRNANALSTKLLDRVVELSTLPGDLVVDPFGGSGTTYAVCEAKGRRWIGAELDFSDAIVARLTDGRVQPHPNSDYIDA